MCWLCLGQNCRRCRMKLVWTCRPCFAWHVLLLSQQDISALRRRCAPCSCGLQRRSNEHAVNLEFHDFHCRMRHCWYRLQSAGACGSRCGQRSGGLRSWRACSAAPRRSAATCSPTSRPSSNRRRVAPRPAKAVRLLIWREQVAVVGILQVCKCHLARSLSCCRVHWA